MPFSKCESVNIKKSNNFDNRCGYITFCIQLDKRVYALNCLHCQQICLQWDTFIGHMETKHNEEFSIDEGDEKEYLTPIVTESQQNKVFDSMADMDDGTSLSSSCDPLDDKNYSPELHKADNITPRITNNTVLRKDSNDDNLNKSEYLSDEISSQSPLSFVDDNDSKKIVSDETKLTGLIIKYYKQHTLLWQTNMSEHRNIKKHHEAYENITTLVNKEMQMNLKSVQVKGKIYKLRSRFRKEHEIATQLSTTSENVELEYDRSYSWLYKKMCFLKDYINDGKMRSNRGIKALTNDKCHLPFAKLTLEKNRQFIALYKSYPCLWDVNHIGFRFKNQRRESMAELLESINSQMNLNFSIEDLQKKLYYIRYAFTQEKHRQIELEHDFIPQCELYNDLLFLKDSVGPFKCEYCEQRFNGPDQYKIHKSSHDGSMPYSCPQCKKGFMKVGNCTVHLRRHTKDFQFECKECGKKFPTSTDLNVHSRRHTGEKPYFCEICGQSFRTWTYFDSHRRRHENKPSHKCSICLKGFYENNKLKQHMKSHLNLRDKVCNICGKSFTCTKYLNQHKLTHAENKKYACKMCEKKFAQYGGLSNHIKAHMTLKNSSMTNNLEFSE